MNEIEKLYMNARITPRRECEFDSYCPLGFGHSCESCDVDMRDDNSAYPPFTAEKQLELIKWLADIERNGDKDMDMTIRNDSNHPYYYFGLAHISSNSEDDNWGYGEGLGKTFEEGLARLVIDLWQDLTEEEKQQIKDILE